MTLVSKNRSIAVSFGIILTSTNPSVVASCWIPGIRMRDRRSSYMTGTVLLIAIRIALMPRDRSLGGGQRGYDHINSEMLRLNIEMASLTAGVAFCYF